MCLNQGRTNIQPAYPNTSLTQSIFKNSEVKGVMMIVRAVLVAVSYDCEGVRNEQTCSDATMSYVNVQTAVGRQNVLSLLNVLQDVR